MEISNIKELLYRLNVNSKYSVNLLQKSFKEILLLEDVNLRNVLLGSLLTALMTKKPSSEEVVKLLEVAFSLDNYNPRKRKTINIGNNKKTVTIVGSGKKGIKTINISTASAFLAASLGAYVVKPGSCSTSSITGSADFMNLIGANNNISLRKSISVLKKCGFAFFQIEKTIPKFDKIYGGNFYVPQILSFGLAALICPIKTNSVLYGLAHPNVELSLNVLKKFDLKNVMVVSSTDDNIHFIDEMGIFGKTRLIGTTNGRDNGPLLIFNPLKELKLPKYTTQSIKQGNDKIQNVKFILNALKGNGLPAHEDIICINCSNILYLTGIVKNLKEGYQLAKKAIKTGQGYKKIEEYLLLTGGNLNKLKEIMGE